MTWRRLSRGERRPIGPVLVCAQRDACEERLCGRTRRDGREALLFAEPGVGNHRQVVFVDAILELAALIRREHEAGDDA